MQATMDMTAELARLRAENAKLTAAKEKSERIRLKVSEKGALSLYGLGRFPVTLYKEQWARILAPEQAQVILEFIEAHDHILKAKE